MPAFPSLEWYQALAERMNTTDRPIYEHIGEADVRWCLRIKPDLLMRKRFLFGFVFEEYGCTEVVQLDAKGDAADFAPEFILEARYVIWADILHNSQRHDGADLGHTLNILSVNDDPIHVEAVDQLQADKFYRFGQTFQEYMDAARHLDTEWIKPLPEGGLAELMADPQRRPKRAAEPAEG